MKIYKTDSPVEKAVQEVEKFMRERGVSVYISATGLTVEVDDLNLRAAITEFGRPMYCFPRQTEDERLAVLE